ncbi:binding-protein-dependent transport systems inner membrane component [Rhodomicrobium vannielii ATCC 17100]|uniref:Binding-protein-dependent transport systems inner membrane component n=1 Tax=Rhodomicrobium vannielii (strain ATCC 17100 / DSM 162 / LMG 4299 / NCIMB 10020 / ATH 3.1.1) TaxID=648757 RepID=E3I4T5_RHOVT|nr:ABC transporter permease [Rhodomicrobium vannielii]ADP72757.1 binding-protein-dependent transport systems inner membrane component [Rhodomicrobium vannielii ATCC 17100]
MTLITTTLDGQGSEASNLSRSNQAIKIPAVLLALAASASWLATAAVTYYMPDVIDFGRVPEFAALSILIGAALIAGVVTGIWQPALGAKVRRLLPWSLALGIFTLIWQLLAGKLGVLPQPFFPPPHGLLEVFTDDYPKLIEGVLASLRLEFLGFAFGAIIGFWVGVALGWSRTFGYWVHPIMRFIGPVPSIAWLPIAFFAFPSSFSASIFLIALTTGFPVAVLTWSGVASVNPAYYDVARTLGANERFLIFKVAIPAALPHVFVGLFMGLGASFAVLVTAEMMGVKAGLGFYLQWAQGWAAYANMYAALIVMALMCTGLVSLLFKIRDRVLSYQKGDVKW